MFSKSLHSLFRSILHELVLSYVAHLQEDSLRMNKRNIKFIDILQTLVHYGMDVNTTDINRQTALHLLASHPGHFDIIRILLASGLKSNLQVHQWKFDRFISDKCLKHDSSLWIRHWKKYTGLEKKQSSAPFSLFPDQLSWYKKRKILSWH